MCNETLAAPRKEESDEFAVSYLEAVDSAVDFASPIFDEGLLGNEYLSNEKPHLGLALREPGLGGTAISLPKVINLTLDLVAHEVHKVLRDGRLVDANTDL